MRALRVLAPAAALLVTLLSGCATGPDPTQVRLDNLDARVGKLEQFVSNGSLVQLAQQQNALQAEVRSLRGRVDSLEEHDRRFSRQQRALYADLNKRMGALERASAAEAAAINAAAGPANAGAAGSSASTTGTAAAADGGGSGSLAGMMSGVGPTQQSVYQQAFDALKSGSYSVAISGFKGFLKTYPTSPLAPNAEYWLGEAHYVNQDFNKAEKCFRTVLKRWPDSGKAAAAMFDLGNTLIAQGHTSAGHAQLRALVKQFPGTDLAKRAASVLHPHGQ
ncbi:MAG: tol-pal system protein YbgF [Steroidobacteraceae bacterium]